MLSWSLDHVGWSWGSKAPPAAASTNLAPPQHVSSAIIELFHLDLTLRAKRVKNLNEQNFNKNCKCLMEQISDQINVFRTPLH